MSSFAHNKKIFRKKKGEKKKVILNNILTNYSQKIEQIKKKKRIHKDDFEIPTYKEYEKIKISNFNVSQLKEICKYYHISITGNKPQLRKRIYTLLKLSYYCTFIQKIFRGYITRQFFILSGAPLKNTTLCTNKTDFLSLEPIKKIPPYQFISFKTNKFIFGFELESITNLINNNLKNKKKNSILKNPYNRNPISYKNLIEIQKKIRLANLFKHLKNTDIEIIDNIKCTKQKFKFRVTDVFHRIDMYGHTTNMNWFLDLNQIKLLRFIRELKDMWFHRLNLSNNMRKRIYPPDGNPFANINPSFIIQKDIFYVQNIVLKLIENFVTRGIGEDNRTLGVFYILTALTLVSENAAQTLPWLYESALPPPTPV